MHTHNMRECHLFYSCRYFSCESPVKCMTISLRPPEHITLSLSFAQFWCVCKCVQTRFQLCIWFRRLYLTQEWCGGGGNSSGGGSHTIIVVSLRFNRMSCTVERWKNWWPLSQEADGNDFNDGKKNSRLCTYYMHE